MKIIYKGVTLTTKYLIVASIKEFLLDYYYNRLKEEEERLRKVKPFRTDLHLYKAHIVIRGVKGNVEIIGARLGFVVEKFIERLTVLVQGDRKEDITCTSDFYFRTFQELNKFTSPNYVNNEIAKYYLDLEKGVFTRYELGIFEISPAVGYKQSEIELVNKPSINALELEDVLKEVILVHIKNLEKLVEKVKKTEAIKLVNRDKWYVLFVKYFSKTETDFILQKLFKKSKDFLDKLYREVIKDFTEAKVIALGYKLLNRLNIRKAIKMIQARSKKEAIDATNSMGAFFDMISRW